MTKYADDCAILIHGEMEEGIKNHGLFASPHEGLAIIMEEVEEAREAMVNTEEFFQHLKVDVYCDDVNNSCMDALTLYQKAKELMIEAMQVAAMAEKFVKTFGKGKKDED